MLIIIVSLVKRYLVEDMEDFEIFFLIALIFDWFLLFFAIIAIGEAIK